MNFISWFRQLLTGAVSAPYAPIAAEQTATGYEIAWKAAGADQYTVWTTDSTGNFISTIAGISGNSLTLESLEPSFHQDLNGDGVIGVVTTVIEALGSTSLVAMGENYFLNGAGPSLKYTGVTIVAGQFAPYAPIAAEQKATCNEIASKALESADRPAVSADTDSTGNFISNIAGISRNSLTLESLEPSFHLIQWRQRVGAITTVIRGVGRNRPEVR